MWNICSQAQRLTIFLPTIFFVLHKQMKPLEYLTHCKIVTSFIRLDLHLVNLDFY